MGKPANRRGYPLDNREGEPVLTRAVATTVVGVVAALAARFGLPLTETQTDVLEVLLLAGLPLLAGVWARRRAWSGRTVAELVDAPPDGYARETPRLADVTRQARQVTRLDPQWLRTWVWPLWLAAVAVSFTVLETLALVHRGDGGTLSERTRAWLGIRPGAGGRRGAWALLVAGLVTFTVWFSGHMLQWWPWER